MRQLAGQGVPDQPKWESLGLAWDADGWIYVLGLPGWESHTIAVQAEVIEGEPRVTALKIEPRDDATRSGVTGLRLKTLPLRDIAHAAASTSWDDTRRAFAKIREHNAPRHHSRASVSMEQFVETWQIADASGQPTRETACTALGISTRTYDRYRRKAVDQALIPDRKGRGR
ncbi:MAG: hypothetical protein WKF82_10790 [Nocardioidaceae bacterium]